MAWQHIHLVRELQLPHIEKLLLFAVASRVDDKGECWPSVATLRMGTGLAQRTVQYHLRSLVDRGLLLREERRGATAVLRLRLCEPCMTARLTGVQDGATKEHTVHPPVHDMHASSAPAAPEVTKELPINRHEQPSGGRLSTKSAGQNQTRRNMGRDKVEKGAWWTTRAGIDAKGRDLRIPPRPGEDYAEYKDRLFAAERQRLRSE